MDIKHTDIISRLHYFRIAARIRAYTGYQQPHAYNDDMRAIYTYTHGKLTAADKHLIQHAAYCTNPPALVATYAALYRRVSKLIDGILEAYKNIPISALAQHGEKFRENDFILVVCSEDFLSVCREPIPIDHMAHAAYTRSVSRALTVFENYFEERFHLPGMQSPKK